MTDSESQLNHALTGRYRLLRLLGEGGMARVYLAEDLKHQREVALKVLRPELAVSLGPERFQREITTAARLQHPHILTVFDSGSADDILWFTMPYVEGESLRTRLERERQLPVDEALRIAREAGQALQHAHEHGVIHRDIKPDNILLTRDGSTLVADFGIARGLGEVEGTAALTQTGMSLGTPAYMSPEQASGDREVDGRSDQYALGAVLYEMLAGEPPYTGPTPESIIAKRFTLPVPSLRTTRGTIAPELDRAVSKALALVPGDRFATIAEFRTALSAPTATMAAPPPRRAIGRRTLVAAGALVIVAAGALFAWQRHGSEASVEAVATPRIAVLPFENRGDTADAYFADGMTDAVRGRLSRLPGLEVIARGSSTPYLASTMSPAEIARELGVRYLLTAVVRFERMADGVNVVHLTPELVEVMSDGAPTTRWQQPFDQPLTNVFQVQSDIADEVAARMRVALGTTGGTVVKALTDNPRAYDAFLRAESTRDRYNIASLQEAIRHLEEAVALDSTFGEAWAALSIARSNFYSLALGGGSEADGKRIRQDALNALKFAPDNPRSHRAMGIYYRGVEEDHPRAMAEYEEGLRLDPNDAESLGSIGLLHLLQGEYEQAISVTEAAVRLDPRYALFHYRLSVAHTNLDQYAEAEEAARRANAITPGDPLYVNTLYSLAVIQGDLAGAKRIVADAALEMSAEQLFSYTALYGDFTWLLDSTAQEIAMAAPLVNYGNDQASRDMVRAQIYHQRGDSTAARIWADSAQVHYAAFLREHPGDIQAMALRTLALAFLGRDADARAAATTTLQRLPTDPRDLAYIDGLYARSLLTRTYLVLGDIDLAITTLDPLIGMRGGEFTPARLRIDPNFAPLLGNPRFEALLDSR